ncbi:MAG: Holliday junction branch migration protein RuvA [Anaerolineaceae bacterium]|nr:Holliday junction branch migration protein RuvA [Anaerolineaceae bacterium]
MIASIHGLVESNGEDFLIIRVGGIGVQVFVPGEIAARSGVGQEISLSTHLVVREDSLTLYGFQSQEEKKLFTLFMGVNGVGPRTALAGISTLSVDAVRRAVSHEQAEIFSRIPGVGKKGAQKILLHLQGKVEVADISITPEAMDRDTEVFEALTGLGYSVVEAQTAIQFISKDAPDEVEERLRLALQFLSS